MGTNSRPSIRVSDEAKKRLELEKRDDESFEDVILRLTSTDKWSGFGVLADDPEDARKGIQRMRTEMRDGFEGDIEGSEDA